MNTEKLRIVLGLALVAVLMFTMGCEDEDCSTGPETETGYIQVSVLPDTLQAPWSLRLPDGLNAVGSGDSLLAEMPVGSYTHTWFVMDGWLSPDQTQVVHSLTEGDTLFFEGEYTEQVLPTGAVTVIIEPSWLDAPWVLSGPDGNISVGTHGSLVWIHLPDGEYSMAWGTIPGWVAPPEETLSLTGGGTITFTGLYTEEEILTGTITIDAEPDDLDAGWTLTGPEGFSHIGSGDLQIANLQVGEYSISWDDVDLWTTPVDETLTLETDATLEFLGEYESVLTNPDVSMSYFHTTQEAMDMDDLSGIIDPSFRLMILPETIDEWAGGDNPLSEDYFGHDTFLQIHSNLFSGLQGLDPIGNPVAPVESIDVVVLEKQATWEAVHPEMEYYGAFEGAQITLYQVLMHFNLAGNSRFEIDGLVQFVVQPSDSGWRLLGIRPLSSGVMATESVTYDGVLSLYR